MQPESSPAHTHLPDQLSGVGPQIDFSLGVKPGAFFKGPLMGF